MNAVWITALATFFATLRPLRAIERAIEVFRWECRIEGALYALPVGIFIGVALTVGYFGVIGKRR